MRWSGADCWCGIPRVTAKQTCVACPTDGLSEVGSAFDELRLSCVWPWTGRDPGRKWARAARLFAEAVIADNSARCAGQANACCPTAHTRPARTAVIKTETGVPDCDGSAPVRCRSLVPSANAFLPSQTPAGASTDLAGGGSGHADTINSNPTRAAADCDLRDHAVRLRNRCRRHSLRRSCDG